MAAIHPADAAMRTRSFQALKALYCELATLIDGEERDQIVPFTLIDEPFPLVKIGAEALISFGATSDLFTFVEGDNAAVFITSSRAQMLSHAARYLFRAEREAAPHASQGAVLLLVGQTLQDVERVLTLETLFHCRGNSVRAATLLGISVDAMREKLNAFWGDGTWRGKSA